MKIFNKNGQLILEVEVSDSSFRYRSVMKGNSVTLYYSLVDHVEIPVGSYIEVSKERYTLFKPENFSKKGSRNYEYTVIFESDQELLKKCKFKMMDPDPENMERIIYNLVFPLAGRPEAFLMLMKRNLDELLPKGTPEKDKWQIGKCVDASDKALAFNHDNCYEVLTRLASEFNTEWEIEGRTIHLCKIEKDKDNPLALSYGKGNGFKTGVGRQTQGDKPPVTRLFVQGGERNIDPKTYKNKTLRLPLKQELEYEGRKYKSDDYGNYIERIDRVAADTNEDSYDASHIYPKWEGTVLEVVEINEQDKTCTFKIEDPATQPDFTDMRIPNEKATIIFQDGLLVGKEFDIVQKDDETITGYTHSNGTFCIHLLETDGSIFPNKDIEIKGNRFAVFHIKLPDEYVCDNTNKKGGSWEMFKEAARYMYEHEDEQFSFTGELDGIWAKKNWLKIGGHIKPGAFIRFSDTEFQPEGILIRITGVKDYINNPYSPEIELSNIPVGGFVSTELGKIESNEVVNDYQYKDAVHFTKRRWRDAKETMTMLENVMEGFSEGITPVWVQTMSMLVGDESLQFRFVDQANKKNPVYPIFEFKQETQTFSIIYPNNINDIALQHLTLGIDTISPSHDVNKYKCWDMGKYITAPLDKEPALYLYAVCNKTTMKGYFSFFREGLKMDGGDVYNFLVGILSSNYEGERSYTSLYGFTEILPGRITTKNIVSESGNTSINLETGEIKGTITFTSGSTGLENVNGWNESQNKIIDALQEAEEASNAANKAEKTANDKAKVFYVMPPLSPSGMQINDLWYNGTYIKRYNGSSWDIVSDDTVTTTKISGGLITTGAITFGNSGGMTGSGSVRIWSGGTLSNAENAKFVVRSDGDVYSSGNFYTKNHFFATDDRGYVNAGFNGGINGTNFDSVMLFVGNSNPQNAPFKVTYGGSMETNVGRIGSFIFFNGIGRAINSLLGFDHTDGRNIILNAHTDNYVTPNQPLLILEHIRSASLTEPKTWIECTKAKGWGSKFVVESRYLGDANEMERTVINVGPFMSHEQLTKLSSSPELLPVYYDTKSGYLCFKY